MNGTHAADCRKGRVRAPLAWPYHRFPRDAGGNRTHLNRVAARRLAIWGQRQANQYVSELASLPHSRYNARSQHRIIRRGVFGIVVVMAVGFGVHSIVSAFCRMMEDAMNTAISNLMRVAAGAALAWRSG